MNDEADTPKPFDDAPFDDAPFDGAPFDNVALPHEDELPPDHRSGFVTLVGKPNVGKSTLLNAWLGVKIMAVSAKPQTTRNRLLGILTRPDAQVIFVDTPGIHDPRHKLGELMVATARNSLSEADVILFLVDGAFPPTQGDERVAELIGAGSYGKVRSRVGGFPEVLGALPATLMAKEITSWPRKPQSSLAAASGAPKPCSAT